MSKGDEKGSEDKRGKRRQKIGEERVNISNKKKKW